MRVAIIGASRGLGKELNVQAVRSSDIKVLGVSRKTELLNVVAGECPLGSFVPCTVDLSKNEDVQRLLEALSEFAPDKVFYVAGGGPYGFFHERPFHSHQWAWKVSFETAARVAYWALHRPKRPQVILIGSGVCESRPDPQAASYSAAKHALNGLFKSLREEYKDWDLRLFSPGYLDTELLPKNAPVRYKKVWDAKDVASVLWHWSNDETEFGSHKILSDHP